MLTMTNDAHAGPPRAQEPLFDPDLPAPSHAERARTLLERLSTGTLCTLALDPPGHPYGSFITFALAGPSPVFLISEMAEHTRNLRADARASLLCAEAGEGNPLALGRVTVLGRCLPLEDGPEREAARQAFLGRHPASAHYETFRDFHFWRLAVESARYIGGFGRMSWVTAEAWGAAAPDPMAPHAAGILAHMNDDHAAALVDYCRAFSRATEVRSARMTGIDRYGFELSAETPEGPRPVRVAFPSPIATPEDARRELVGLVKKARERLGQ